MKKLTKSLVLPLILGLMVFAVMAQTYWPNDATKNPIRYETWLGQGFVVGTNNAACDGSIAIGGNEADEKAIVLDAVDAMQIGNGTNAVDNSLQFHDHYVALVFTDGAVSNTVTTDYEAPVAGTILIGKVTTTNKIWIATGSGTNSWELLN